MHMVKKGRYQEIYGKDQIYFFACLPALDHLSRQAVECVSFCELVPIVLRRRLDLEASVG
jgi:hypothetical protein